MDILLLYIIEFIAILAGVIVFRKYIYRRQTPFDRQGLYYSFLATLYIWTITVSIDLFGPDKGFILGIIIGAFVVLLAENATGFLYKAGY
jgi:uncharacterized membrane protein